jgi:hypothetical protein
MFSILLGDGSLGILDYLSPFLDIVQSEIANGPITSVALSSLLKFMQYGYLDMAEGINSLEALELVLAAAMKCKFEALDPDTDAVVMFKILKMLQKSIQIDTALLLSDQVLYDMVQTCFKLSIQGRVSVLLRKSAEMALTEIFQFVFTGCDSTLKNNLSNAYFSPAVLELASKEESDIRGPSGDSAETVRVNTQGVSFVKDTPTANASSVTPPTPSKSSGNLAIRQPHVFVPTTPPFGIPGLIRLLRFLCTMINPRDPSTTEPMRYLGLTLVNIVLEIRGSSLADNKRLMDVFSNDVCRYLIQSVRCEQNLSLLSITLRICINMFLTFRGQLTFQLELFLRSAFSYFPEYEVHDMSSSTSSSGSATPAPAATPNAKSKSPSPAPAPQMAVTPPIQRTFAQQELALDALVQLCRDSTFALELLVCYDCQVTGPNMFETLVKFFENITDPRYERVDWPMEQIKIFRALAHSALSSILLSISNRHSHVKEHRLPSSQQQVEGNMVETSIGTVPTAQALLDRRATKQTLKSGADQFNAKPREGLKFLVDKGVLPDPLTAESVANFCRTNPFLNKAVVGEYFVERKDFNLAVLKAYALTFDWASKGFFEAFREFLESFRIPGEAPAIEKILDVWSRLYYHKFDEEIEVEEEVEVSTDAPTTPIVEGQPEQSGAGSQVESTSDSVNSDSNAVVRRKVKKIVNRHPLFRSLDACYVVVTSIVLLNVDMYNPNVKEARRMTIDQYVNNLRGQNAKENFPPEFLRGIYTAIRASEIRIAEEHMQSGTAEIPQSSWQTLWTKQQAYTAPDSVTPSTTVTLKAGELFGLYDELIFGTIWKVVTATTKQLWLENYAAHEGHLASNFYALGNLSAHFHLSPAFDTVIAALTDITTMLQPYKDYSFELRFTQDKKAQVATNILFDLAHQHANVIREGWKSINDIMIALQTQSVLPPILDEVADDSTFQFKELPPPAPTSASQATPNQGKTSTASPITSMLSSLWKWGSGAAASAFVPLEPTEDPALPAELERYRAAAKQILVECHLPDVISACSRVDADSLLFFMQVLILGSTIRPAQPAQPARRQLSTESSSNTSNEGSVLASSKDAIVGEKSEPPTEPTAPTETAAPLQHPQPTRATPIDANTTKPAPTSTTPKLPLDQNIQNQRRLAPRPASKNRFEDSVALYCVDMLAHLALLNAHRVFLIWPVVASHFTEIIRLSEKPTSLTERAIVNMLVVIAKLLPAAIGVPSLVYGADNSEISAAQISVATHMCKTLEQALSPSALGAELSKAYSHRISHAMRVIVRRNTKVIAAASVTEWMSLFDAVSTNMMDTAEHMENLIDVVSKSVVRGLIPASLATSASVFNSRESQNVKLDLASLSSTLVTSQNIRSVHSTVLKLLTHPMASLDAIAEGMDCAQALLILGPPRLSNGADSDPVWHDYLLNSFVLPIFSVMARLSHDARIVVRQTALSQLQKAFCSPGLSFASSADWIHLFHKIIFPLLDSLLAPHMEGKSQAANTREATEESLMRSIAVLSKSYLHCMPTIIPTELVTLWKEVLSRYTAFHRHSGSDVVQEQVFESVKNTLSVMHSAGILLTSPPEKTDQSVSEEDDEEHTQSKAKHAIWLESWIAIDRFAPSIRKDFTQKTGLQLPPSQKELPALQAPQESATSEPVPSSSLSAVATTPSRSSSPISSPSSAPSSPLHSSSGAGVASPTRTGSPINPPGTVLEL